MVGGLGALGASGWFWDGHGDVAALPAIPFEQWWRTMRVLVADDEVNVQFALRTLLEGQPSLELAGAVRSSAGLWSHVTAACPDLVLLDWELRDGAGSALLSRLRRACPGIAVIALSGRPEARPAALAAGADAFVSKVDPPDELLAVLLSVRRAREQGIREDRHEKR
jgi:DNA-binding NarL/FixJ family response regulator